MQAMMVGRELLHLPSRYADCPAYTMQAGGHQEVEVFEVPLQCFNPACGR